MSFGKWQPYFYSIRQVRAGVIDFDPYTVELAGSTLNSAFCLKTTIHFMHRTQNHWLKTATFLLIAPAIMSIRRKRCYSTTNQHFRPRSLLSPSPHFTL
jgi:hypothetical protein